MNHKFSRFIALIALAIVVLVASACNNPNAAKTNHLTGDRTWAQTTLDAEEACATIGQEVLAIDPENGDPYCGLIAISAPVYTGEMPAQPDVLGSGPAAIDRTSSGCPTVEEANKAVFGGMPYFVQVSSEACAFQINTVNPDAAVQGFVPSGVIATIHSPNEDPKVYVGNGQSLTFWRATFRWTKGYPTTDVINAKNGPCQILSKEDDNGMSQNPAFHVFAGNISCK